MADKQTPLYFDRMVQLLLQAKKALAAPVEVPQAIADLGRQGPRPVEVPPPGSPSPARPLKTVATRPNRATPTSPGTKASA